MVTDRANAICLLEILREYSDEQHVLPMRDIIQKMNNLYDINPDRRTVYSAVSLLINLGYDVSTYEENGVGYYLRGRAFEESEIRLLTDAVFSFPFISAKQSEELISKLQKHLSIHSRKRYRHLTVVKPEKKTNNRQVFLNVELLDEAIQERKQVEFSYLQYGMDKMLHLRREKPYVVNPYGMVFMNEHYYLVCNLSGKPNTSLYRLDRIKDIRILESTCDKSPGNDEEVENAIYAFSGKPEYIKMRCNTVILNDVVDRFGSKAVIKSIGEKEFELVVKVSPHGIKFWALQYLPYVEVLEPVWLREEIVESIRENRYISLD